MFKGIVNYITYKKKLRLLKMIAVNHLTNFVVNNNDYINGLQKLALTASQLDNAEELQKTLNEFIDLTNKAKVINNVISANDKNDEK